MPGVFSRSSLPVVVSRILDIDAIFICSAINYFSHTFVVQMKMVKLLTLGSDRKEVRIWYNFVSDEHVLRSLSTILYLLSFRFFTTHLTIYIGIDGTLFLNYTSHTTAGSTPDVWSKMLQAAKCGANVVLFDNGQPSVCRDGRKSDIPDGLWFSFSIYLSVVICCLFLNRGSHSTATMIPRNIHLHKIFSQCAIYQYYK